LPEQDSVIITIPATSKKNVLLTFQWRDENVLWTFTTLCEQFRPMFLTFY